MSGELLHHQAGEKDAARVPAPLSGLVVALLLVTAQALAGSWTPGEDFRRFSAEATEFSSNFVRAAGIGGGYVASRAEAGFGNLTGGLNVAAERNAAGVALITSEVASGFEVKAGDISAAASIAAESAAVGWLTTTGVFDALAEKLRSQASGLELEAVRTSLVAQAAFADALAGIWDQLARGWEATVANLSEYVAIVTENWRRFLAGEEARPVAVRETDGTSSSIDTDALKAEITADVRSELERTLAEFGRANGRGMVVMPSTGSTTVDSSIVGGVMNAFSDEVRVDFNRQGAGYVTPIFREGAGDRYLFILTPVRQ